METLDFEISPLIEKTLKSELNKGNSIAESSKGWPERKSTLIILKLPFLKKYNLENIEYKEINNPHYRKEEYYDKGFSQTIVCRF